jgi:hypothetical protein
VKSFGPKDVTGPGCRLLSRPLENLFFFAQSSGQQVAHLRDPQNSETTFAATGHLFRPDSPIDALFIDALFMYEAANSNRSFMPTLLGSA